MTKTLVKTILMISLLTACGQVSSTLPVTPRPTLPVTAMPTSSPTASPTHTPPVSTATIPVPPVLNGMVAISATTANQVERLYTLTGHTNRVSDLAFSADGTYLASTGWNQMIRLWDLTSRQEVYAFPISEADIHAIAFSPTGGLLASAETIWDMESKQQYLALGGNSRMTGRVNFSPDGSLVVVGGFERPTNLWDVSCGQVVRTLDMPSDTRGFFDFNFSPDGKYLAAGSGGEGRVYVWEVETGQIFASFRHDYEKDIHAAAFSPDGRLVASGGTGNTAIIWDVTSGEALRRLNLGNGIYDLTFSPDGTLVATAGCDRRVKLWEVESGRMLRSLPHADELMAVAFSPDGKLLAASGYDPTIVMWGISTLIAGETPDAASLTDTS